MTNHCNQYTVPRIHDKASLTSECNEQLSTTYTHTPAHPRTHKCSTASDCLQQTQLCAKPQTLNCRQRKRIAEVKRRAPLNRRTAQMNAFVSTSWLALVVVVVAVAAAIDCQVTAAPRY